MTGATVGLMNADQEQAKALYKAPNGKVFPSHWGPPPERQSRDLRPLPMGFGSGSGTLREWILQRCKADAQNPLMADTTNLPKEIQIQKLQLELALIEHSLLSAKDQPEYRSLLIESRTQKQNSLTALQAVLQNTNPSFEHWKKTGKKIPEGRVFAGGSPWFDESSGKKRTDQQVYDILYPKSPKK
jgi:hypothetical protein